MDQINGNRKEPVTRLVWAAILCWVCGCACVGFALLRWLKGEVEVPDGTKMVPVSLYKDALAVVHVMNFHLIPAVGAGYLMAATLISVYLSKHFQPRKRDKDDE